MQRARREGYIALARGVEKFSTCDDMKTSDTRERQKRSATSAAGEPGDIAKPMRARPVEGEIDHEELTREIISRFPKILSELAK